MEKYKKESRIDKYIQSLPLWQQDICNMVRRLVHEADVKVEETIKRGNLPYFVLNGNICALMATKDHINIFIYDPIAPDPKRLINQGHGNATARAIQVEEHDVIEQDALRNLFKAVIENNRAGGWRKIQKS